MVTLKEIAEYAGVSIATVSNCINNTKKVKTSTRDRIMQAIQELNYIPNDSARKLRCETSREIGVVFPDIDDLFHSENGITGTSATYSPASGGIMRVEVESERDGLISWQNQVRQFAVGSPLLAEDGTTILAEDGEPIIMG